MTTDKAPFTVGWIFAQAVETVRAPRDAARTILGFGLPAGVVWQALALVVVVSVLIGQLSLMLMPGPEMATGMMLVSPMTMCILQFATLAGMALAIHVIGRAMGGTGDFAGSLAIVTWLQVVLVCVQLVQSVALLLMPPLGIMIGWIGFVLFLWLLTNFVAVLHGFASLGMVFVMILMSSLGIMFVLSLLLTGLGFTPPEGFNV